MLSAELPDCALVPPGGTASDEILETDTFYGSRSIARCNAAAIADDYQPTWRNR